MERGGELGRGERGGDELGRGVRGGGDHSLCPAGPFQTWTEMAI